MINLLSSRAASRNKNFKPVERTSGDDNVEWIKQNIKSDQTNGAGYGGERVLLRSLALRNTCAHRSDAQLLVARVMLDKAAEDLARLRFTRYRSSQKTVSVFRLAITVCRHRCFVGMPNAVTILTLPCLMSRTSS